MPTVRKLTGRNAIDMGFRRIVTPPVHPTPMETAPEPANEQPTPVVVMPPAKKRVTKIDAVPVAQMQQRKLRVGV
jgi:hypothetical protein